MSAVTIVQSKFQKIGGTTTISLPGAVTPNNHILVMAAGYPYSGMSLSSPYLPLIEQHVGDIYSFQGQWLWYGGTTGANSWTFSEGGDMVSVAIFELANASNNFVWSFTGGTASGTTLTTGIFASTPYTDSANTLNLMQWESDGGGGNPVTAPSGFTVLNDSSWLTYGGHPSSIYEIPYSASGTYNFTGVSGWDSRVVTLQVSIPPTDNTAVFYPNNFSQYKPYRSSSRISTIYGNSYVGSGGPSVLGTDRQMTGNTYFEIVPQSIASSGGTSIGLAGGSYYYDWYQLLGDYSTLSMGYFNNGTVRFNGSTIDNNVSPYYAGNTICVAADIENNLIYFKVDGGYWNNNSSCDPSIGTGGINMTYNLGGSVRPAVSANAATLFTGNFSANSWTYSAPAGFVSMDETTVLGTMKSSKHISSNSEPAAFSTMVSKKHSGQPALGNTSTSISGYLQKNGILSSDIIRIYDRITGTFVGETTSAANGYFWIPGYGRSNVYIVAIDTEGSVYNGIILDNLTPQ